MGVLIIPRSSGIYKITCTANNKIYIGSSVNLRIRWRDHKNTLRKGAHRNSRMQNAWNKYGEDSFTFEVIELVMPWSLLDREQYWLDKLKPYDRNIGFNINPKAESAFGRECTPETRAKIGAANRGRKVSDETRSKLSEAGKGRKHNAETLHKMSLKSRGRKLTPEAKEKISIANKGKKRSPEEIERIRINSTGRKHTAEAKAKVSAAKKGIKRKPETVEKMRVAQSKHTYLVISPDGKESICRSLNQFCKENGLDIANMYRVASGKQEAHKGWRVRRLK